ncbi:MAG TPA: TetR family transcriptional regulator C-terminal domain-containing protein [Elusimicrobiota bacterium]|nr:TetR family transcriptional regulator C-terminal domain-containing protein [Elusimicrobiota bacterium]
MGRKADPAARERVLAEAEHIIHLRGYHRTSMDEIAESCGMSKANLFHYYKSKEDLGLAVLDAKISDYQKRRVSPLCDCLDPVSAVEQMFQNAAKLFRANGCKAGCFVANIALEMADVNDLFRKRAGLFFKEWAGRMAERLGAAQKSGFFDAALDPQAAAESVVSLYEGAVMLARTQRDSSIFARVGRAAASLLEQHKSGTRRHKAMGPKTPCGC